MSNPPVDNRNLNQLGEVDRLVHEPARLMILAYLSIVEAMDFVFLMRQTGLTTGNLSSHLNKLEEARYIEVKKEFVEKMPRTLLRLTPEGKRAFQEYQQKMLNILGKIQ